MNNTKLDFPAIMNDARLFTDYRSSCVLNARGIGVNILQNGMTSMDYRNNLQTNADKYMKNINTRYEKLINCTNCPDYSVVDPIITSSCDENKCIYESSNDIGIGLVQILSTNNNPFMGNVLA